MKTFTNSTLHQTQPVARDLEVRAAAPAPRVWPARHVALRPRAHVGGTFGSTAP